MGPAPRVGYRSGRLVYMMLTGLLEVAKDVYDAHALHAELHSYGDIWNLETEIECVLCRDHPGCLGVRRSPAPMLNAHVAYALDYTMPSSGL